MAEQQERFAIELKDYQERHALAFNKQEKDFIGSLTALTEKHRVEMTEQ